MKETFLTGGDWPVFFTSYIQSFSYFPDVWSTTHGNGFGQNIAFVLGYRTFFISLAKFFNDTLFIPWFITEKVIFFIPFWVLAFLASYYLSKYFFQNKVYNFLSSVIFATNTYSLMLVGGGQMGVALAYAYSPFVLLSLLRSADLPSSKRMIVSAISFGLLLLIDPRIAGVILLIAFCFIVFFFSFKKLLCIMSSVFFALLLNSFWILPFLFSGTSGLAEAYTGTDILYFLSFAKFENTLGLLHPNWPENLFGKVYFMRPEFLMLPFLAFSVFLFKTDKKIKILGILAILGIFLSKGVNDPFGFFYYVLSDYIPAFTMFRDSTKWYLMVVVSYSILIPLALYNFTKKLIEVKKFTVHHLQVTNKLKKIKYVRLVIIISFLVFWIITIRQLFFGELTGTFQMKKIPEEYVRLEKLLSDDLTFSRVLWVPQQSRFGYFSDAHPPVATYDIITSHDVKPTITYLLNSKTEDFIKKSAIKYMIVPYDYLGEMYVTDRKYDEKVYQTFLSQIKHIPYLVQDTSFKDIGVFRVKDQFSHAYFEGTGEEVALERISGGKYIGVLKEQNKLSKIIFSETYDPSWRLKAPMQDVQSQKYLGRFNSFEIFPGTTKFELVYEKQMWVQIGLFISCITLGMLVTMFIIIQKK